MFKIEDYDSIRPYYNNEVNAAVNDIIKQPIFHQLVDYFFTPKEKIKLIADLSKIEKNILFQTLFMYPAIHRLLEKTNSEFTVSGMENLKHGKAYMFISNHRDILLDSTFLEIVMHDYGHDTTEITFGSNLMENPFIVAFGRINRMFTVFREGNSRELYLHSKLLSSYMRYTITEKNVGIWIAQRNGRTKDGDDKTQPGLFKMLNISGGNDMVQSLRELSIVPVSISYELESCDALKVQELYLSQKETYKKKPGEDLNSILTGAMQPKKKIHLAVGKPLDEELESLNNFSNENDKIKQVCQLIDNSVHTNYQLYPNNYIAADLLNCENKRDSFYNEADVAFFYKYMSNQLTTLQGDAEQLKKLFLTLYANPVFNREKLTKGL